MLASGMVRDGKTEHRFKTSLRWTGGDEGKARGYRDYSRELRIEVEGKAPLKASAAGVFLGDERLHNPEDLLVASLSACHCLSYLAECARAGLEVVSYRDEASGTMRFVDGAMRFVEVTLRPEVALTAGSSVERAGELHARANALCFIANSVNFPVRHEAIARVTQA